MENMVRPIDCRRARGAVSDIGLDEFKTPPCVSTDTITDILQIAAMSGRKIVQSAYPLACTKQGFDEMRTDKAGGSGHQPKRRTRSKSLFEIHHHR